MKKINYKQLLMFVFICEVLGSSGAIFTTPNIPTWYAGLQKAILNPPNWVFAPVWTLLFALIGIATYLIWREGIKKKEVKEALTVFGVQFIFNILWSLVFFGQRNPLGGLLVIIPLWFLIAVNIYFYRKVNKVAGWVLLPYFLWVSFAGYLNLMVFLLN